MSSVAQLHARAEPGAQPQQHAHVGAADSGWRASVGLETTEDAIDRLAAVLADHRSRGSFSEAESVKGLQAALADIGCVSSKLLAAARCIVYASQLYAATHASRTSGVNASLSPASSVHKSALPTVS